MGYSMTRREADVHTKGGLWWNVRARSRLEGREGEGSPAWVSEPDNGGKGISTEAPSLQMVQEKENAFCT